MYPGRFSELIFKLMKNTLIALAIILLFCISCQTKDKASTASVSLPEDSSLGIAVADTIIYDVSIVNENPEDSWAEQRLKGLDHSLLVDTVFHMIYTGKVTAYDHTTGEKLTSKQVEKIEQNPGFSRSDIGMIQFKEAWYIDPDNSRMTKDVISMVLGIGIYSDNGEFRGNKALFRVELK
jgi:hypothetical protein